MNWESKVGHIYGVESLNLHLMSLQSCVKTLGRPLRGRSIPVSKNVLLCCLPFPFIANRSGVCSFFLLHVRSGHVVLGVADARVIRWMATRPAAGLEAELVFFFLFVVFFSPWT